MLHIKNLLLAFILKNMPVSTRAMVRAKREHDQSMNGQLKLDVLCTQGISTLIAEKLHHTDTGLKSFCILLNDERFRHELEPFKRVITETQRAEKENNIKKILMSNVKALLDKCEVTSGMKKRLKIVIQIYEYLCNEKDNLFLLGKNFGKTVENKMIEVKHDIEQHVPYEINRKEARKIDKQFLIFGEQLNSFYEWANN